MCSGTEGILKSVRSLSVHLFFVPCTHIVFLFVLSNVNIYCLGKFRWWKRISSHCFWRSDYRSFAMGQPCKCEWYICIILGSRSIFFLGARRDISPVTKVTIHLGTFASIILKVVDFLKPGSETTWILLLIPHLLPLKRRHMLMYLI